MNSVYTLGFSDRDTDAIAETLSRKGVSVVRVDEDPLERITSLDGRAAIFLCILSKEDVRLLKRLKTEVPEHFYAVGLPLDDRKVTFSVMMINDVIPFFLPVVEDEVTKVFGKIRENLRLHSAESRVYGGLKVSKMHFEWKTSEIAVSGVCRYLARLLKNSGLYRTTTEEENAALALEEALVNSIEHGNLELDSSLRPKDILEEDRYEILKEERLKDEKYADRKIYIDVSINDGGASLSIRDEGPGFDTSLLKDFLEKDSVGREEVMDVSGKGFTLIRRAFDGIEYNDDGTVITLTKKRNR